MKKNKKFLPDTIVTIVVGTEIRISRVFWAEYCWQAVLQGCVFGIKDYLN